MFQDVEMCILAWSNLIAQLAMCEIDSQQHTFMRLNAILRNDGIVFSSACAINKQPVGLYLVAKDLYE